MKIELTEMTVPKRTPFGTVQRSLNQHKVWIFNEDVNRMIHCAYVGVNAFLPLSGFPRELLADATAECERQLNRKLIAAEPPPSQPELELMRFQQAGDSDQDEDDE